MNYVLDKITVKTTRFLQRYFYKNIYPLFSINKKVCCPICHWQGFKYLDFNCGFGNIYHDAECPSCLSHPRHRLVYLFIRHRFKKLGNERNRKQVLHVAPEHSLEKLLKSIKMVQYLSIDIDSSQAMKQENLENLSLTDNTFDIIICLDVLEHVNNDRKAMRELWRVLRKKGICIIDVPVDQTRKTTFEDKSIVTPKERASAFWQEDHVRLYGRDFPNRLRKSNLLVSLLHAKDLVPKNKIKPYGLPDYPLYICSKHSRDSTK